MNLQHKRVGIGITGSFCNFNNVKEVVETIKEQGAQVTAIISNTVAKETTRFFKNSDFKELLEKATEKELIDSIVTAEPIGPKNLIDILLICPCTGNTLAKFVHGITDTPVLMAMKSHIRNNKPVVIGISTNDALGCNFKNIGELYNMKNVYFVPFYQDDYVHKPKSLVTDYTKVVAALEEALDGKQLEPILARF